MDATLDTVNTKKNQIFAASEVRCDMELSQRSGAKPLVERFLFIYEKLVADLEMRRQCLWVVLVQQLVTEHL